RLDRCLEHRAAPDSLHPPAWVSPRPDAAHRLGPDELRVVPLRTRAQGGPAAADRPRAAARPLGSRRRYGPEGPDSLPRLRRGPPRARARHRAAAAHPQGTGHHARPTGHDTITVAPGPGTPGDADRRGAGWLRAGPVAAA